MCDKALKPSGSLSSGEEDSDDKDYTPPPNFEVGEYDDISDDEAVTSQCTEEEEHSFDATGTGIEWVVISMLSLVSLFK